MQSSKKLILMLLLGNALAGWVGAAPLGTAINYQGYLSDKGKPATGLYDFRFKLYDALTGGSLAGSPNTLNPTAVPVTNGLFNVELNFGSTAFPGDRRWLEIAVAPNGSSTYTVLSPRAEVRPGAYSLYALKADAATTASGVSANAVSGAGIQNGSITANKIASGEVVKSLNGLTDAVTISAGAGLTLTPSGNTLTLAASGWSLTGNSGTTAGTSFLGTTDNQPLELHVDGSRAFRLAPTRRTSGGGLFTFSTWGINVLGGYDENFIGQDVIGATIAGGGFAYGNFISPEQHPNVVVADFGAVGGGADNSVTGRYGVVPGGLNNTAGGETSFAAGRYAGALHDGSFVWNDGSASAPQLVGGIFHYDNETTAPNQFRVMASGGVYVRHGAAGVNIDQFNSNNGDVNYSLRFGLGSGEAIGSKRTTGGNQWGLDFYTAYANRMSIANNGKVGIGTTSPGANLHVQENGSGVGVFAGDLSPFGTAAIESNLSSSRTHAWFAENNNRVFSVAAGGEGFFAGNVSVCTLTIRGGCDLAEPFQVSEREEPPQGSVMIIDADHPGHLKMSTQAYDTRVAGIVSGAGGVQPGIQMSQQGALEGTQNIALTGRVYVKVDASESAIKPGDLLTTSDTPGHAMKVTDHARAQGAILGKAMSALQEGRGLVLVLVTLQ